MSEVADKNIGRYVCAPDLFLDGREGAKFCLTALASYQSDDPKVIERRDYLLDKLARGRATRQTLECTIGNCDRKITDSTVTGTREVSGVCLAAAYCIKEAFEAVPGDDGSAAINARYRAIMDTCEGFAGRYSAGNFCPRLDCGLSAGFSEDMIPGTSGECVVEIRSRQGDLMAEIEAMTREDSGPEQ